MARIDDHVPFLSEVQDASRNPLHKFGEKFFKIEGTRWGRTFVVVAGSHVREKYEPMDNKAAYGRNALRLLGTITVLPMLIALFSKLAHRAHKQYNLVVMPAGSAKQTQKIASTTLSDNASPLQKYLKEHYPDFVGKNARELQAMGHPLHFAAQNKDWQLLQLLIDDGADLVQQDAEGRTALQFIFSMPREEFKEHSNILTPLIKKEPEAFIDFISYCTEEDDAWLRLQLPYWVGDNLVPIAHAVLTNRSLEQTGELIINGYIKAGKMDVDASVDPKKLKMPLLYKAANTFDINLFIKLCGLGAKPLLPTHLTNPERRHDIGPATPLAFLVRLCPKGAEDMLFPLLDLYVKKQDTQIMHELLDNKNLDREQVFTFLDKVPGLDLSARDESGLTILWKALGRKDYELCEWLVKKGVDFSQQGDENLPDSNPRLRMDSRIRDLVKGS